MNKQTPTSPLTWPIQSSFMSWPPLSLFIESSRQTSFTVRFRQNWFKLIWLYNKASLCRLWHFQSTQWTKQRKTISEIPRVYSVCFRSQSVEPQQWRHKIRASSHSLHSKCAVISKTFFVKTSEIFVLLGILLAWRFRKQNFSVSILYNNMF